MYMQAHPPHTHINTPQHAEFLGREVRDLAVHYVTWTYKDTNGHTRGVYLDKREFLGLEVCELAIH